MILYGIKNCDTTQKAVKWLTLKKIPFEFHDYKEQGITEARLNQWCKQVDWEKIFNKKSTTWRELDEAVKNNVIDQNSAIPVMKTHNSIIKRPILEREGKVISVGWNEKEFSQLINKN